MNHFVFLLFLIFIQFSKTQVHVQAQAQAPAPAGPTNVSKILEKAGQFTTLIKVLQITQIDDRINTELNNSNQGLTLLAPTDAAFSALAAGTLNSLNDQQKVALIQFHILPSYLSLSQFQTVSNPMRTQAGDTGHFQFPLNVTTVGNQVNLTTGINNATVGGTVYTDGQLAVYQVDNVLLPMNIFGPQPPAPAPAPPKPKKKASAGPVGPRTIPVDSSDAAGGAKRHMMAALGVAVFAGFYL